MDDEDETEVTLSVEWSEDDPPQKKKTTLQKILQTWASKSRFNGDCTVLKVSEDGRAVIKIKPAAAVTELQNLRGQTLIGRDGRTVIIMSVSPKLTELTTQTPDNASMTPPPSFGSEPQHVKGQHEEESNMMASAHTDNASVDLQQVKKQLSEQSNMTASTFNIPMHHYWYVNHAYQEEIKRLEKASGTKITAEVKLTFEAQQKDGNPDYAFSEFANLVQKCSAESRGFSVPLGAVNAEGWRDTVKIIQRPENKLLVALSSEEMTVCGPRQSQDAIRKSLKAAQKAAESIQASPDASLNTADSSERPSTSRDGKAEDEDEVQVLLSVKWSEGSQPQKCKLDLQRALRTWDNNRGQARNKARDYTVLKVSEDGRAVIRIKPSPAVSELQQLSGQTLKGTDGKTVTITSVSLTLAELEGQTPDKTSGSKPQHVKGHYRERNMPKSTFNVPKCTDSASVNPPPSSVSEPQCDQVPRWRQSCSSSSAAASPTEEKTSTCQVPVRHFWDMNHILKEEIKHIERVNRVQMNAAVHVTLEGSKKNEKCLVSTRPLLYRPSGLSTRNTEAPREEGATGGDKEDENCPICRDRFTKKKQLKCKHEFCEECLEQSIKHLGSTCPVCKDVFGMMERNQPDGKMSVYKRVSFLPGFEGCGTVINDSYFPNDKPDRPEMNAEPGHSARNTEAPREEGATAGDKEDENCPICRDRITKKKQLKCKHEFCEECLEQSIKYLGSTCPVCKDVFGMIEGNQPEGRMSWRTSLSSLPGFPGCGTIVIDYYFPSGKQTEKHPNPGQYYHGTSRIAYLPGNKEGKEVLRLLERAFKQKLTFTVGRSTTTGRENQVTWNGIHHKTSTHGGPESFGYPDPDYLRRVREQLNAKGIK